MEIPLNAQVECTDGVCGHSVFVLINPVNDEVTQLVVKTDFSPHTEYLVSLDSVSETTADTIRLRCTKAELEKMEPFISKTFIQEMVPERYSDSGGGVYGGGSYYMPFVTPDVRVIMPVDIEQIPPGELTVRRGTRVEATDGYVGNVDEFVVNPENCHITHLVMREGHLWGQKDIIIPISALKPMGATYKDIVFLNLDKHEIESLPTFPVHRRWS